MAGLGRTPASRVRDMRAGREGGCAHLVQVLGLDLVAGLTHLAGLLGIREDELVDNDVVRVDLALGQLLDQPLRFIQGQELSNAHTDEGGLLLQDPRQDREGQISALSLSPELLAARLDRNSQDP